MIKKILPLLLCFFCMAAEAQVIEQDTVSVKKHSKRSERRIQRVDRSELKQVFIPKGTWTGGVSLGYNEWDSKNMNMLVMKNVNMEAYTFSVAPGAGYFIKDNMAVGLRYSYNRTYFNMGSLELNLGEDMNINLDHVYYLEHQHEATAYMRNYTPLFGSKIFGVFAESTLTYYHATGKNSTGQRNEETGLNTLDGSYSTTNGLQLGLNPGICVFVTDFAAVETSIGVMGLQYQWSNYKNLHPGATEYEKGSSHNGGMNFRINLFSIKIGFTLYI